MLQGLPDPATIESQRKGFAAGLDKQLADGTTTIQSEKTLKKKMLSEQADMQKNQYATQVNAQLQAQNLALEQQMNVQLTQLQEAHMAQRSALEQQAAALTLEYQQKKAEEEMLKKQYEIQKQFFDAETKLANQFQQEVSKEQAEMNKLGQQAAALGMGTVPMVGMPMAVP